MIQIMIIISALIIACGLGWIAFKIITNNEPRSAEQALIARENLNNLQFENSFIQKKYDEKKIFLSEFGLNYQMGKQLFPTEYWFLCLCLGIFFGLVSLSLISFSYISIIVSVFAFILGFKSLDIIVKTSNTIDNNNMLQDIQSVYTSLRLQTMAGDFLSIALTECYQTVKHKRLKTALFYMAKSIEIKGDIESALAEFNIKFRNPYIDSLVTALATSLRTGQATDFLNDISNQMIDVEHAVNMKKKDRIEMGNQLLTLLVFIWILAVIIFLLGTEISSSIKLF